MRGLPALLRKRPNLRLLFLLGLGNLLNFLSQVLLGRSFNEEEFSQAVAALALINVVSVASGGVQTEVAREVARGLVVPRDTKVEPPLRRSLILAGLLVIVGLLFVDPLASTFELTQLTVLLVLLSLFPSVMDAFFYGYAQGRSRFDVLYGYSLAQSAIRTAVVALAIATGSSASIFILILVVASCCSSILVTFYGEKDSVIRKKAVGTHTIAFTITSLSMWYSLSIDLINAHAVLGKEGGAYVAAASIAKLAIWLPVVVAQVLFPTMVIQLEQGVFSAFKKALTLIATTSLVFGSIYFLGAAEVISRIYGDKFVPEKGVMFGLAVGIVTLSIAMILISACNAQGSRRHAWTMFALASVGQVGAWKSVESGVHLAFLSAALGFLYCVLSFGELGLTRAPRK